MNYEDSFKGMTREEIRETLRIEVNELFKGMTCDEIEAHLIAENIASKEDLRRQKRQMMQEELDKRRANATESTETDDSIHVGSNE